MWKQLYINGIETNYEVSSDGQIRKKDNLYILKQHYAQGYKVVTINVKGSSKRMRVHRLVAMCYIENPENKPYVNHKNGTRDDNRVENLEWVTPKENAQHAAERLCHSKKNPRARAVAQYSLDGALMQIFESATEAAKQTGSCQSNVTECCRGQRVVANGYQWRYYLDNDIPVRVLDETNKNYLPFKKVAQLDEQENIIQIYNSYREAAKAVGGTSSAISRICSGKTVNKRHKGFKWKLVEDIVQ